MASRKKKSRPKRTKKPVSRARSHAARNNGTKSRGPVTEEGKAKSSRNALTHSLLAQRLSPLRQGGYARIYDDLIARLNDQYEPRTAIEFETIAFLAADLVQLSRAREMIEQMVTPDFPNPHAKAAQAESEERQQGQRYQKAMAYLAGESAMTLSKSDAADVAEVLSADVTVALDLLGDAYDEQHRQTGEEMGHAAKVPGHPVDEQDQSPDVEQAPAEAMQDHVVPASSQGGRAGRPVAGERGGVRRLRGSADVRHPPARTP